MNQEQNLTQYIPGVCNIGEAEINERRRIGIVGLVLSVIIWIAIDVSAISQYWKLVIFFPASLGATGFLQAWMHFCAGFGIKGVFNFGNEVGKFEPNTTDSKTKAEYRAKDKQKAISIAVYSVLIGAVVTAISFIF